MRGAGGVGVVGSRGAARKRELGGRKREFMDGKGGGGEGEGEGEEGMILMGVEVAEVIIIIFLLSFSLFMRFISS